MPAAIPLIALAVGGATSAYQAHKAGQTADAQTNLMNQQSGLAREMAGFGQQQYSAAQPALQKAMNYYQTLAGGDRGAISNLLAPQRASISDTFSGAQNSLEAKMAPGPGREEAIANLMKQKTGQLGLMPIQARNDAVGHLGAMGQNMNDSALRYMTGGQGGLNSAGNLNLGGAELQNNANSQWNSLGNGLMQAFLPYLMDKTKGGSGGMLKSNSNLPGGNVQWNLPGGIGGM